MKKSIEKFIENKTGMELSLNAMVQFIIVVIVVVVIVIFFIQNFGENFVSLFEGGSAGIEGAKDFDPTE